MDAKVAGILNREDAPLTARYWAERIEKIVNARYEQVLFSFFYGSMAIGKERSNSDVDLIVLQRYLAVPYREKFRTDGCLFDVFLFDPESLHGALQASRRSGNFAVAAGIVNAITIPAPTTTSAFLSAVASQVCNEGFSLPAIAVLKQRQHITSLLDDLLDCNDRAERYALSVDLYKTLMESALTKRRIGLLPHKLAARTLRRIDACLAERINDALAESFVDSPQALVTLALEMLGEIGGALREGFRVDLSPPPRLAIPPLRDESM